MVSAPVPPPVTKLVDDTVVTHEPERLARRSVTWTSPSSADTCVEPDCTVPRLAVGGTEIDSVPVLIVNVVVVDPVPAARAGPAGTTAVAAAAAMPSRLNINFRT